MLNDRGDFAQGFHESAENLAAAIAIWSAVTSKYTESTLEVLAQLQPHLLRPGSPEALAAITEASASMRGVLHEYATGLDSGTRKVDDAIDRTLKISGEAGTRNPWGDLHEETTVGLGGSIHRLRNETRVAVEATRGQSQSVRRMGREMGILEESREAIEAIDRVLASGERLLSLADEIVDRLP